MPGQSLLRKIHTRVTDIGFDPFVLRRHTILVKGLGKRPVKIAVSVRERNAPVENGKVDVARKEPCKRIAPRNDAIGMIKGRIEVKPTAYLQHILITDLFKVLREG